MNLQPDFLARLSDNLRAVGAERAVTEALCFVLPQIDEAKRANGRAEADRLESGRA